MGISLAPVVVTQPAGVDLTAKIAQARAAKFPDKDIADMVASVDSRIEQARAANHSDTDILDAYQPPKDAGPATPRILAPSMAQVSDAAPMGNTPRTPTPNPRNGSPGEAFADHAVNALALGQGHRIAAASEALQGHGTYRELDDKFKASLDEDTQDHPITARIGGAYGTLLNPLNEAATTLGVAKGVAPTVGRVAGGAAVLGGVQGSGDAPDTFSGQLFGTALGAGTAAATAGLLGKALETVKQPTAGQGVTSRAVLGADNGQKALDALDMHDAAGNGDKVILADLTPRANSLADKVAQRDPAVMDMFNDVVDARHPDAAARVRDAVSSRAGDIDAPSTVAGMKTALSDFAKSDAGFDGLRERGDNMPIPEFREMVSDNPAVKRAMNGAMQAEDMKQNPLKIEGLWKDAASADDLTPNQQGVFDNLMASKGMAGKEDMARDLARKTFPNEAVEVKPSRNLTYGDLQDLHGRLDDKVTSNFNAGRGNLANQFKVARDAVRAYMEKFAPGHAEVNAKYGAMKQDIKTFEAGTKAWDNPSLQKFLAEYSPLSKARKELYRRGLVAAVLDKIDRINPRSDAALEFATPSTIQKAKLKAMFGNEKHFNEFLNNMKSERDLAKLRNVATGSRTARASVDEPGAEARNMLIRAGASVAHGRGLASSAIHAVVPKLITSGMRASTASEAGGLLNTTGSKAIREAIANFRANTSAPSLLEQQLIERAAVGAGHGVTAGLLHRRH